MKAKIGQNHALKDIVKISRYFLMFPNDAIYCFRDISRYKMLNPDGDILNSNPGLPAGFWQNTNKIPIKIPIHKKVNFNNMQGGQGCR